MSRTRRAILRAAALAAGGALAGCSSDETAPEPAPSPTPRPGPTERVSMFESAFSPAELSIEPGTTVVWENGDPYAHTVTAASGNWSVDVEVPADGTARHTFSQPGLYDVYCRFHGNPDLTGMSMRIAVGAATIPPA